MRLKVVHDIVGILRQRARDRHMGLPALTPQSPMTVEQMFEWRGADEIERLRTALHEIVRRTDAYRDDWDGWPLVAGINDLARKALASD